MTITNIERPFERESRVKNQLLPELIQSLKYNISSKCICEVRNKRCYIHPHTAVQPLLGLITTIVETRYDNFQQQKKALAELGIPLAPFSP
jgi:hypothetical protein